MKDLFIKLFMSINSLSSASAVDELEAKLGTQPSSSCTLSDASQAGSRDSDCVFRLRRPTI